MVKHHVIFVPGLDDKRKAYDFLINKWSLYGVTPHVHRVGWYDGEKSFKPKLKRLITEVNSYLDQGNIVSLVGNSAGGSAVLNALIEQPKINAVVSMCGRLRKGKGVYPTLEEAASKSPSFKDSVLTFEKREPGMTIKERRKILNLIPMWDEVVPISTASLKGATNQTFFSIEHILSSFLGLTLFSPIVIKFIKEKAKENQNNF